MVNPVGLSLLLVFTAVAIAPSAARPKRRLDKFVSHYEELDYDTVPLQDEHSRVKRETLGFNQFHGEPLIVSFATHDRYFRLQLKPHHHVFHPRTKFQDGAGKSYPVDMSEMYSGRVIGDDASKVAGSVHNGKFHGVIQTKDDRFHVEPARRYFDNPEFHSIVYKATNVEFDGDTCGASPDIRAWMQQMQKSAEKKTTKPSPDADAKSNSNEEKEHSRKRRAVNDEYVECRILIAGDHLFSQQIAKEEGITIAGDRTGVVSAVARVLARYVMNVNMIYQTTDFNIPPDGSEGVTFAIKTVNVFLNTTETSSLNSGLANQLVGVDRFLDLWSQRNLNEFCLAYLFTHRDFDNGVLGLAWVGSSGSSAGGVCDRYTRYSDGLQKTLNTGIVTTLNFGRVVAREVSYLTFAHELGHNMGSNHDPASASCSPGGSAGNYIMYAHATSGTMSNNRRFSSCSRTAIGNVLSAKGLRTDSCFDLLSNGEICGNGIVDPKEDCDCGTMEQCSSTIGHCCDNNCTLTSGSQCSPQQGPCCSYDDTSMMCSFASDRNCSEATECRTGAGSCTGSKAACELAPARANGTFCNEGSATCLSGNCRGSLCAAFGKVSCFCTGDDHRCQVCCQSNGTCLPIRNVQTINSSGLVTQQRPGAPCDDFEGFCDFFGFCRRLDDLGPIARLRKTLFSSETIDNAIEWSKKNWWAVALAVLGLVIIMALIIYFLSKNTKKTVEAQREKIQQERQNRGGQEMNNRKR